MVFVLALLALHAVHRQVLIVDVPEYPPAIASAGGYHTQLGVANDAETVQTTLGGILGFAATRLDGPQATKASVLGTLSNWASMASPGDEYVLYFSGLGSVAPVEGGGVVPSLVPYDALPNTGRGDITMGDLAAAGAAFDRRHARITFMVDACYTAPPLPKDTDAKPWRPVPRCFIRGGDGARLPNRLYSGPGVMLAACSPHGCAYELKKNASDASWNGAFTLMLTDELGVSLGERLPARELMLRVSLEFTPVVRNGYLTGQDVAPPSRERDPAYEKEAFTSNPPSVSNPLVLRMIAARAAERKTLRIAIDPSGDVTDAIRAKIRMITDLFKAHSPFFRVVNKGELPDRVLTLASDGGSLELFEPGGQDERDDGHATFATASLDPLERRLDVSWVTLDLYRFLTSTPSPMGGEWRVDSQQAYRPGDHFGLDFHAPEPGHLVLISREDGNGVPELFFPNLAQTDESIAAGAQSFDPTLGTVFTDKDSAGRSDVIALLLPASFEWKVPPASAILPADGHATDATYYVWDGDQLDLLTRVRDWVEKPGNRWGAAHASWVFQLPPQ